MKSFNQDAVDLPAAFGPVNAEVAGTSSVDAKEEHLKTDHLLTNLKGRTVSSGAITIFAQMIQFFLMLGSTMVLARLLTPHDFGLVAMVTTIIAFFRIFNEAGLSTATVQREGITHAQVSNLFWTNLIVGAGVAVILALSAPIVSRFYREPQLNEITLILSVTFLFTTATVQHLALFKRQMRFKLIALIQVSSVASGILVGVTMAFLKFGYWSLVGMQVTTPLTALLMTWTVSTWRPQLPTWRTETRSLLHFGANLTASSFLWSVARGSDGLLIGRSYGPASLGLYSRGAALLTRPIDQLIGPIESVFVPMLSRLQGQPQRYRRIHLKSYEVVAIASFLGGGLLFALARPLSFFVLGPKWEGAASIFAGFTLIVAYSPISSASTWLLTSQGRGRDFLLLSLVNSSVTFSAFLAGLPFGPAGVAFSYSAACFLILLPAIHYIAGRRGPVTTRDLWGRFLTHLPLWLVVSSTAWISRFLVMDSRPLVQLLVGAPIGLLAGGVFICIVSPTRRCVLDLIQALRELGISRKVTA